MTNDRRGTEYPDRRSGNRRWLLRRGGTAAAGAAVAGLSLTASAEGDTGLPPVVGSFIMKVTPTKPPLGNLAAFTSFISFHVGNVVTESRRYYFAAVLLECGGHGAWKQTGPNSYEAFLRFIVQTAPPSAGTELGTDNVHLYFDLGPSGDTLSGTFESDATLPIKGVELPFAGTISGTRIEV